MSHHVTTRIHVIVNKIPPFLLKLLTTMAPKHPYINQARKAILIHDLDTSMSITAAAKDSRINIKTARGIKRRVDQISVDSTVFNLEERVQLAPKPGRYRILSDLEINTLDQRISKDKKHRDML